MVEYGIWTDADGGFSEVQMSRSQADARLVELIAEDPDNADDLSVVELCGDHEEQPAVGCEECDAAEEDDAEDDE